METASEEKRTKTPVSVVLSIILSIALLWLFYTYASLHLRVSLADGYITIFEEMRTEALASSRVSDAVGKLRYTIGYYPSGSTQIPGSKVDRIVETARGHAIRDIVAHLRTLSSEDLGDEPEAWLERYP